MPDVHPICNILHGDHYSKTNWNLLFLLNVLCIARVRLFDSVKFGRLDKMASTEMDVEVCSSSTFDAVTYCTQCNVLHIFE